MPEHPEYINGIKVRVIPPGVFGSDIPAWTKSTWDEPPDGYEMVRAAMKRLGLTAYRIRLLCKDGKLAHIRRGRGKKTRLFIRKDAKPRGGVA